MKRAEGQIKERNQRIAKEMKEYLQKLRTDHQQEENKAALEKQKEFDRFVQAEKKFLDLQEIQKQVASQRHTNNSTKSAPVLPKAKIPEAKKMIQLKHKSEVKPLPLGRNHKSSTQNIPKIPKTEEKPALRASKTNKVQEKTSYSAKSPDLGKMQEKSPTNISKYKNYYDEIVKKNFAPSPSFRKQIELVLISEKLNENKRKRKIITKTRLNSIY